MKSLIHAVLIAAVVATSGCAMRPTQQEMASADYGPYPSDYERTVKNHMNGVLKDPESARYDFFERPKPGWNGLGGAKFGYIVCANINAKNSYGGYTGNRLSYFMIRNDRVIYDSHGDGGYGSAMTEGLCGR